MVKKILFDGSMDVMTSIEEFPDDVRERVLEIHAETDNCRGVAIINQRNNHGTITIPNFQINIKS